MAQGTSFGGFGLGLHQGEPSGSESLLAAQRGSAAAFDEMVLSYDAIVMRVALALTGSEETAQDIYCRVFRDAFASLNELDSGGSVFVWLHQVLVKHCIAYCRLTQLAAADTVARNGSLTLSAVLRTLPPQERLIFLLKHSQGLKIPMLAEIFACPPEYIEEVLRRGTRRLRTQLGPRLQRDG